MLNCASVHEAGISLRKTNNFQESLGPSTSQGSLLPLTPRTPIQFNSNKFTVNSYRKVFSERLQFKVKTQVDFLFSQLAL